MREDLIRKVGWLTASAAGLLLAAGAVAQEAEDYDRYSDRQEVLQQHDQRIESAREGKQMKSFSELDEDGNGTIAWSDLEDVHKDKLQEVNWDEDTVMEQFDTDSDGELSEEEYDSFQTALTAQSSNAVAESQAQDAGGPQEVDSTLLTMSVADINDAEVVNSRGEEIGSVSRVVRDNASGNLALVVESGGVLGLGAHTILVDLTEVSQMSDNQLLWETLLSRDELAEMPEFDDSQYTEISALDSTLSEVQEQENQ